MNNSATTEADIVAMSLRLAGTAKQANMSESDILALASSMSSLGISSEAGGGSMSRVMQKINSDVMSGKGNIEKFAKVAGMSASEFQKAWKEDAASALTEFVKGLGNAKDAGEDVTGILKKMGITSTQEVDTMLRLSGAGDLLSDSLKNAGEAWEENTALSEEAQKRYESFESKLQILKNRIVDIAIDIGGPLMEAMKSALDAAQPFFDVIAKLAKKFAEAKPETQKLILTIAGIAVAIGPVLTVIGGLLTGLGTISGAWAVAFGGATAVTPAIQGLSNVFKSVSKLKDILGPVGTAFKTFGTKLLTGVGTLMKGLVTVIMANPILAAVIAAVAAIAAIWYFFGDDIKEFFSNLWKTISENVKTEWNEIKEFFNELWQGIKDSFTNAWDSITTFLSECWSSFIEGATAIWDGLKNVFTFLWLAIKEIFNVAWIAISTPIILAWQIFINVTRSIWEPIVEFFSQLWEGIKTKAIDIWNSITNTIKTVWASITSTTQNVWNAIKTFLLGVWDSVKSTVSKVWDSIKKTISDVWDKIVTITQPIWNKIKTFLVGVWDGLKNKVSEVWNNVKTNIQTVWNTISSLTSSIWNSIKSTVTGIWDGIKNTTSNVWNGIKSTISNVIDGAKSIVKSGLDAIKGFFDKLKLKFPKIQLPHFSIKGKFSLNPPSVPNLSVNWYKTGGIFNGASVVGVGEAGKEAVLPLEGRHMLPFAKALAGQMNMRDQMESYANTQNHVQIIMYNTINNDTDGNKFVDKLNKALGNKGVEVGFAVGRV